MQKVIHRAGERGFRDHGWLATHHSFSFGDFYQPDRMGFGALRVLNDDIIAPSSGFPMHGHRDMEIITIVAQGAVTHTDSIGNTQIVSAGEVQVMSAGTGIIHREHNASTDTSLALFQLWIKPEKQGIAPRYAQKSFDLYTKQQPLTLLVSPAGTDGSLSVSQLAWLYWSAPEAAHPITYPLVSLRETTHLTARSHGLYIFVVEGELAVADETLTARDALGVWDTEEVTLTSPARATALLIEVPI